MTIYINGTTGISGVDGSAGTPAVQGTDTNTGVFYPSADTVGVSTGGSERLRVDSSGNVGIGTSSPSSFGKFVVQTSTSANTPILAITDNVISPQFNHYITDSSSTVRNLNQIQFVTGSSNISNYQGYMTFSTMGSAGGTISERMRIDASGNLLFNSGYGSVAIAYGCRAWVNFNGTGTVAIRASGNVTSITDNGTGDYTVNFTNAMPDANYSFVATSGSGGWVTRIASMAAGNCNIQTIVGNTTTATDTTFVNASIFR